MTPSLFFTLINILAGIGYLSILALSPFWKSADRFVFSIVVMMIAAVYAYLNFSYIGDAGGPMGFSTFDGVSKIFSNPWLIDAAWAHILAFDLVVAIWIKNNAAKSGFKYGIVLIFLLLTIVFAPLGLLVYHLARAIKTKQYFAAID